MRIVICLSVEDDLAIVEATARLTPLKGAAVELLHVADVTDEHELKSSLRPGLVRPRVAEAQLRASQRAFASLEDVRRRAKALLENFGVEEVTASVRQGRPEREIVAHLHERDADLCVIARRPNWFETRDAGPKSIGHVARFAADHARCAVLLLR